MKVGATGAAPIVIENAWVALGNVPLAAVMVPVNGPLTLGVPLIAPLPLRDRPVGRAPAVTVKVLAGEPDAVQVKL